jgi:nucleoside-diphosphate-sugar epimerase
MAGTVFVSGGSGYIAGFLIRQLVAEGWTVHTTIRNLAKEGEVRASLGVDDSKVRFFAADLMADAGWAEAMAGCSHAAHVASPLPANAPQHEDELIVPARDGALRALRAAKAAGVRRFVMTSSMAAVAYGHDKAMFTEADWTDATSPDAYPYVRSKTIAERAAREWVAAEGGGIEFCSVNPALVLGPLQSGDFSTSLEAIKKMLEGSLPGMPNLGFGVVDVRDVADMHVRCLNTPGLANERFLCSGPFMWMHEIAAILKAGLGPQARKVPSLRLPNWLVRIFARFDPVVRQVVSELGRSRAADTSHAKEKLGWVARPVEETILETARDMIRLGIVKV